MKQIARIKKRNFVLSVLLLVVLRFLDLYVTFRYTPDLGYEWNPVISIFGASWLGLILTQILLISGVSFLMYYYFGRGRIYIEQRHLSYADYIYFYFYDKLRPWPSRIFSLPGKLNRHLVFNGFLFMVLTIIVSVFAILHNLMLLASVNFYLDFVKIYYKIYLPLFFVFATLFAFNLFFIKQYLHYRNDQS